MTSELLKELRSRAANEKNITKNMNVYVYVPTGNCSFFG